MIRTPAISLLFVISALYDALLGLAFLLSPLAVYQWYGVTPPNHVGYVQFPAALLIVFAIMFLAIAWAPARNKHLIFYGALLKVSFCGVAFYHWFTVGIPRMWQPFAVIDMLFLILFVWAYTALAKQPAPSQ
jgi:hypothetical protein